MVEKRIILGMNLTKKKNKKKQTNPNLIKRGKFKSIITIIYYQLNPQNRFEA